MRGWPAAILLILCAAQTGAQPVDDFALLDQEGRFHQLSYHADAPAVVVFVQGNGCPIARAAWPALAALRDAYAPRGVVFWMLNANLQDDRSSVAAEARDYGIDLPILIDESQLVAESLGITRTAEAIVIDPARRLVVYRGPIDDALHYQARKPPAHAWLRDALEAQLAGEPPAVASEPARGCLVHLPGAAREARAPISYSEQVGPLLAERCAGCHYTGGVAPFALSGYPAVRGWAPMIREVVRTRRMPPWDADPAIGHYRGDLSLSSDEARLLVHWIEMGAPRGEGGDPLVAARPLVPEWPLGEPDLVVELPDQTLPASGVIDYRYVFEPLPLERDVWIRAADLRPSNLSATHHLTAALRYPEHYERGQEGPAVTRGLFAGYVPGRAPSAYPEGGGFFAPAGSRIRFQLHYTATGRAEVDRPRLGLYLAPGPVDFELHYGAAANWRFEIPPGAAEHVERASKRLPEDVMVYRLTPHMHFRGRWMRFDARLPDGSAQPLLSVPRYDFNWQRQYTLEEPLTLPAGTTIEVTAAFDNSARNPANPDPTVPVRFGEQSFEEMLIGYFLYRELPDATVAAKGGEAR